MRQHADRVAPVSATCLALAWAGAVAHHVFAIPGALAPGGVALALYVALEAVRLPGMGRAVLAGALAAALISWPALDDPGVALERATGAAVFFIAILLSGGFLREAAERSRVIARAGQALIGQPPARRNAALSFGAFAMGFILSFGTLQLLGAMVSRANSLRAANGREDVRSARERRSMLAVLRGFCMSTACNPISVVAALAVTFAPGARFDVLMTIAVTMALSLLALGALMDRLDAPAIRVESPPSPPSLAPVGGLVLIVLFVFACVFGVAAATGHRVVHAMLITVPTLALGWMALQHGFRPVAVMVRLIDQARTRYPGQRTEVTILASAGFSGTLVALALPVEPVAAVLREYVWLGIAVPALIFWWVMAGAQSALNPIITVTIAGAVLPAPLALGIAPEAVAAAYMVAWGVCTASSPFTLSVLIIAGITGQDSRHVAWHWNGGFSAAGALASTLVLLALAMVMPA